MARAFKHPGDGTYLYIPGIGRIRKGPIYRGDQFAAYSPPMIEVHEEEAPIAEPAPQPAKEEVVVGAPPPIPLKKVWEAQQAERNARLEETKVVPAPSIPPPPPPAPEPEPEMTSSEPELEPEKEVFKGIEGYKSMTVQEAVAAIAALADPAEQAFMLAYEQEHKNRKGVVREVEEMLAED